MGHEVSDRYYKLGSSVDVTCQVALSFLNTIPSPMMNANDRLPSSLTTKAPPTTSTTTVFPFLDPNLIRKTYEQHIPYSGKHNIKWRKDGKDLPKDIKINLRFVIKFLAFIWPSPFFRWTSIMSWIIYSSPPPPSSYRNSIFSHFHFLSFAAQLTLGETAEFRLYMLRKFTVALIPAPSITRRPQLLIFKF